MCSVYPQWFKSIARILLMSFILFKTAPNAHGQIKNIVPPSPTAASLGQYGDIPVSNYTGVPSISIPLYAVRSGKIELPISLSYHASGIKVAQEASWVGLGWALNAGGVITRQINGIDDFKEGTGYVKAPALPPLTELNKVTLVANHGIPGQWPIPPTVFSFATQYPETYEQCELSEKGLQDMQPDIFYYNFFGYSGKLFFQKQNGQRISAVSIDQNNLRFIYDLSTKQWEVTDANGWKYFFFTTETTRSVSSSKPSITPNADPDGPLSEDMTTAWYIDRATTPGGDEITFTYGHTGRWLRSPIYYDERATIQSALKVNNSPGLAFTNYGYNLYSASRVMANEVYLTRIDFNGGHITFNRYAIERKDRLKWQIDVSPIISPNLSSFVIYDKQGAEIRSVEFNYSYFRDDMINASDKENYLRLRLDNVQESFRKENGQYVKLPPYKFTYNPTPLPAKNSSSTDHWGFNNGANNTAIRGYKFLDLPNPSDHYDVHQELTDTKASFGPQFNYIDNNVKIFINGADREPHKENVKAGILIGIEYPTGGITQFSYEPNDYYNYVEPSPDETQVSKTVDSHGETEKSFTLTKSAFVFLDFKLANYMYGGDPLNSTAMNNMTAVLEKADGTDVLKFIPSDAQMDGQPGGNNNVDKMESHVCVALNPGTYRIKAHHGGYTYLHMSLAIKYLEQAPTFKKIGPGVRIQSVSTYENPGGILLKREVYKYEESGKSSGRLLNKIQIFYNESDMMRRFFSISSLYYTPCCYINSVINPEITVNNSFNIMTSSGNIIPLGSSAQGNPIGYNNVTVLKEDEDGNNLGKSVYHYKNYEETPPAIFLPNIPQRIYIENGQQTLEQHFNSSDLLVKEKTLLYKRDEATRLRVGGIKLYRSYNPYTPVGGGEYFPFESLPVFAGVYDVYAEWWYPEKTIETTRSVTGGNTITETLTYEYANAAHKQLTKTQKITSEGQTLETQNYYAPDSPTETDITAATFSKMIADNELSQVIKQEEKLDGVRVAGAINNFAIDEHGHIVLTTIKELKALENLYQTKFEFEKYDDNGNLLQARSTNGIVSSFIWSYNTDYPVVRAENVTYEVLKAAVESAAGTADLESFWSTHSNPDESDLVWKNFNTTLRSHVDLKNGMVSTYTCIPIVGRTSETDANGQTIYYQYDDFKRLKFIKNYKGEIVKKYEYHYSN